METHPSFYEDEFRGNWMKFDSFYWSRDGEIDDLKDYGIFYTHNRDSGLIDLANAQVIDKMMEQYVDNEIVFKEDHNHWACGWVTGYAIKVHTPDGSHTPAFLVYCNIRESLSDYPLLDDEVYSNVEYQMLLDNIEQCYQEEVVWKGDYDEIELPEDWVLNCAHFLWNDYPEDTEDVEKSWPKPDHIVEFLLQAGHIKEVNEEQ